MATVDSIAFALVRESWLAFEFRLCESMVS